jgi:preprotein translocase subunit YajC
MSFKPFYLSSFFLLSVSQVLAQATTPQNPENPGFLQSFANFAPMFLVVYGIFYFLYLRPMKQQVDAQKNLLESLKKGAKVVTSSGIIGKVFAIDSDSIVLELEQGAKMRIEKTSISKRVADTTTSAPIKEVASK